MYVDGFVIPMAKKDVAAYRRIASRAGKIWREYGAISYVECVAESFESKVDGKTYKSVFPRMAKLKSKETVVFSWITYKSKADRDRINKKVMKDPRLADMMNPSSMPFDMKRMAWGGFKPLVNL